MIKNAFSLIKIWGIGAFIIIIITAFAPEAFIIKNDFENFEELFAQELIEFEDGINEDTDEFNQFNCEMIVEAISESMSAEDSSSDTEIELSDKENTLNVQDEL